MMKTWKRTSAPTHFFSLALTTIWACGGSPAPLPSRQTQTPPQQEGANEDEPNAPSVFTDAHPTGNRFACATCHAVTDASDDFRRSGHPLANAAKRPSFKNGAAPSLLNAVNSCVEGWMAAEQLDERSAEWRELEAYLQAVAKDEPSGALTFSIVDPPAPLTGGNARVGQSTFNHTCAVCHGKDAVGTKLAPQLFGVPLEPDYVAQRIRKSGKADSVYPGLTGGRMPFWSAERLSDSELRGIIAYLASTESEPSPEAPKTEPDDPVNPPPPGCPTTHPRAVAHQVAKLSTIYHGVSGTVTVTDDCTLTLSSFYFDGNGIDVRLYGAIGSDFEDGFAIGADLYNYPVGYSGATLSFTLPADKTLDDLDSLSIWCVDAAISFGHGSLSQNEGN